MTTTQTATGRRRRYPMARIVRSGSRVRVIPRVGPAKTGRLRTLNTGAVGGTPTGAYRAHVLAGTPLLYAGDRYA